jgi:predicted metal-dependent hydrolase
MWGRRAGDRIAEERLRTALRGIRDHQPVDQDVEDAKRLRALVADIVTAGFSEPPPHWLTDDLWTRLLSEVPSALIPLPAAADEGLFE